MIKTLKDNIMEKELTTKELAEKCTADNLKLRLKELKRDFKTLIDIQHAYTGYDYEEYMNCAKYLHYASGCLQRAIFDVEKDIKTLENKKD